ncbi:Fic family protein, partial [Halomonas sp. BBD48]|nr:Fic family protein [Halomonas sp. BBD48]
LEGITIGGRSLREHLEAINHRDAIEFIEAMVGSPGPLTERDIKDIHALVLRGIDTKEAGCYRRENVRISGASTTLPDFLHLPRVMQSFLDWHAQHCGDHPVRHAAELHIRFMGIHPFIDGNGRTGRLLMNLILMQAGYPPAILRVEDRLSYYDALDEACVTNNYDGLTQLVGEGVERSLEAYLALLEPQPTPTPHGSGLGL